MNNKFYDGYYKYDANVAQTYDKSRMKERHWIQEDRFVKKYLRNRHVENLLDLPVGTGRFFSHYSGVRRVTGVDISEEMLQLSKQKLFLLPDSVSICLEQGDVFNLQFANNTFDAILVFRLFHLLPENFLEPAIKELCRVSSNDVVLQTYVPRSRASLPKKMAVSLYFNSVFRKFTSLFYKRGLSTKKPWCHIQAYYHDQSIIDALFAKHGFLPLKTELLDVYEKTIEVRVAIYSRTN